MSWTSLGQALFGDPKLIVKTIEFPICKINGVSINLIAAETSVIEADCPSITTYKFLPSVIKQLE